MIPLQYITSPYCQPAMTAVLSHLGFEDIMHLSRTCRAFQGLAKELQVGNYNLDLELRGCVSRILKKEGYEAHYGEDERDWFQKIDVEGNAWTVILDLDTKSVVENLFNWAMTTACMYLITWNKAYAIFPYTTFIRRECYMVKELSDSVGDYVTEIEKEGIQVRSISWKQKGLSGNCDTLTRRRRIGDKYSWIIHLDTTGIVPSTVPDEVIEYAAFNLAAVDSEFILDGGPAMRYENRFDVWKHGAME
ncbi:hypothetical protein BKA63DRAFT_496255 [Paraphoma chrysanthemicola]|nr:hypothetical protein BKA63DRAFT_496255 [Paraphoma chrysanthemicola]